VTQPTSDISQLATSIQVMLRFGLRLVILATFAAFGTQGFGKNLALILALAAIFCAVSALMRKETVFGPVLSHWDEAAGYILINALMSRFA
jgi:hypothetical protein